MDQNFRPGDFLVDFTCIYQITSIDKNYDGDRLIHYKPVKGTDKVFTVTIPEKNLIKGGLRKPLSSKEVKLLLVQLKTISGEYQYDIRQVKEDVYLNSPHKMIPHLQYLWGKGDTLPKTDQDLREDILSRLCLEFSFVTQEDPLVVRRKIEKSLQKE